jgi:mannitol-1-phosphate 5-dehydrogenase
VNFFDVGGQTSVAAMLREGLARRGGKKGVIYAAENHNHAAEMLVERVNQFGDGKTSCVPVSVQVLNTVIGKMSGVIGDQETMHRMGLAAMVPGGSRAVLVEEFNRILISRIGLEGFKRGIEVFVEKDDLLPFEEAKLYGHNAIHALIGYLADLRGLRTMAEAGGCADIMGIARDAFIAESGAALIRRHEKLGDDLFTEAGYQAYADDLLGRMIQPNLNDLVERVIRDPVRKLGYDDRLIGTMRMALRHGVEPIQMARGAAAAVVSMIRHPESAKGIATPLPLSAAELTEGRLREVLAGIWGKDRDEHYADEIVRLTWAAAHGLMKSAGD